MMIRLRHEYIWNDQTRSINNLAVVSAVVCVVKRRDKPMAAKSKQTQVNEKHISGQKAEQTKQIDEHDGKVTDQTNVMGKHKQEKSCNMCDTRNVEFLENLNNSVWISCSPGSALEEKRLVLWKHFMTEGSRQTILFQDQRPGLFGMGSTVWIRR